ncbi:hypothetical protein CPB84DRAFT_1695467 [Gymnopilus junonius]|uniref:Uncharacterized protein n=1 Tax=Gymnopilus junonius TaxID=109634 RepID=A0A9P5N8F4_GYMJU|nr:hypothetical protein CPB84DRAFT_1695467 [Gymnopilus junonius]
MAWTDSAAKKRHFEFLALHYCWWNRYSTSGKDAPSDAEPATLRKEGLRRPNTSTFTPRMSKEFQQHMKEYQLLSECFQDVFDWISETLKELLPDDYKIIGQYADILPGDGFSPAYPFSGFIINFNVSTRIHRDVNDKKLCIVMAISGDTCQGGDICFLEPGI